MDISLALNVWQPRRSSRTVPEFLCIHIFIIYRAYSWFQGKFSISYNVYVLYGFAVCLDAYMDGNLLCMHSTCLHEVFFLHPVYLHCLHQTSLHQLKTCHTHNCPSGVHFSKHLWPYILGHTDFSISSYLVMRTFVHCVQFRLLVSLSVCIHV
jgi:hypothetical protein